jgi:hypothetical protein
MNDDYVKTVLKAVNNVVVNVKENLVKDVVNYNKQRNVNLDAKQMQLLISVVKSSVDSTVSRAEPHLKKVMQFELEKLLDDE